MSTLNKLFNKWCGKTNVKATPLVFNCYRAGYINAIKHVVLVVLIVFGVAYVVV